MDTRPNDAALASSVGSRGQGLSSYEELERQVEGIKLVMTENVQVMLENSERAQAVESKAEEAVATARNFKKQAQYVKRSACVANLKFNLAVGGCALLVVLLLFSSLRGSGSAGSEGGGGSEEEGDVTDAEPSG